MEVEHDLSNFTDGRTEILVFKDKEILDEDQDDVLMSYDIQQIEKGKKFQEDVKKVCLIVIFLKVFFLSFVIENALK